MSCEKVKKKNPSNFFSQGKTALCRSFHHCEGLRSLIRTLEARQPHRGENKHRENPAMEQTPVRQGQSCVLEFTAESLFFSWSSPTAEIQLPAWNSFNRLYNSFGLLNGKQSGGDGSEWRQSVSDACLAKGFKTDALQMRHFNFTTVCEVSEILHCFIYRTGEQSNREASSVYLTTHYAL